MDTYIQDVNSSSLLLSLSPLISSGPSLSSVAVTAAVTNNLVSPPIPGIQFDSSGSIISLQDDDAGVIRYLCTEGRGGTYKNPNECMDMISMLNDTDLFHIYNLIRNDSFFIKPGKFVPNSMIQLIWSIPLFILPQSS